MEQQYISQDWPAKDGEQVILSIMQKGNQRKSYGEVLQHIASTKVYCCVCNLTDCFCI
jgi:hypothetical protein